MGKTVEVKLKVPKKIVDLVSIFEKDPDAYFKYSLVQAVKADLDAGIWSQM